MYIRHRCLFAEDTVEVFFNLLSEIVHLSDVESINALLGF